MKACHCEEPAGRRGNLGQAQHLVDEITSLRSQRRTLSDLRNFALTTAERGKHDMDTPPKIAVITGAGSGIGRATAHALLADGWSVVLAGRRREMLEETAALAETAPPPTLVVPTDVRDPAAVAALFDRVKQTYGRIDLLFNNAGISTRGIPFEDLTYEQWVRCRRSQPD